VSFIVVLILKTTGCILVWQGLAFHGVRTIYSKAPVLETVPRV
jgi:hypothetical protein